MTKKKMIKESPLEAIEKHIKDGSAVLFNFDNGYPSPYSYDKNSKHLTLNIPECLESFGIEIKSDGLSKDVEVKDKQSADRFFEVLKYAFENNVPIENNGLYAIKSDYKSYYDSNPDKEILSFFNFIPNDDHRALRMSLFMRSQKNRIHNYKMNIRDLYGQRGNNIANLCSAGYFDKNGLLWNYLNEYGKERFSEYYELVVGKRARALFVHTGMSVNDIKSEVERMYNFALKYHFSEFYLHGIGDINIENITEFVNSIQDEDGYNARLESKKEDSFIMYKLIVK